MIEFVTDFKRADFIIEDHEEEVERKEDGGGRGRFFYLLNPGSSSGSGSVLGSI